MCRLDLRSLLASFSILACACGARGSPPPPGWSGYVPSGAIQAELQALQGRRIEAFDAAGGGEWHVWVPFSVTPDPTPGSTRGKGPNALLVRAGSRSEREPFAADRDPSDVLWVPFLCAADCADFLLRAGATPRFRSEGPPSSAYRAALGARWGRRGQPGADRGTRFRVRIGLGSG